MGDSRKDPLQPQVNGAERPVIGATSTVTLSAIQLGEDVGRDWFLDSIMPEGCFLIVGRPKVGKSWLLLQLAVTVACAGTFLGYGATGQFSVLYIAAEDDAGRIKSRLQRFKVDAPPGVNLMLRAGLAADAKLYAEHYSFSEYLDDYLSKNAGIRVVIIDTESTVRSEWDKGRSVGDLESTITRKDYAEVREFDELAHRRHVFIGLVNHTAKRRSSFWIDIHELINRTNTAAAGASGSWVLADPPGADQLEENPDGCKVLGIRGRDISKDLLLAVRQDDFAVFQNLGPYNEHRQTEAEKEVLECLEEMHKEAPEAWQTAEDIASELGKKPAAVRRAISRMKKAGKHSWKVYHVETKKKMGVRLINRATD